MNVKDLLFSLLRSEFCGTEIGFDSNFRYDAEALYKLSKAHDIAHIVCDALIKNNILPKDEKWAEKFKQEQRLAVQREMQMSSVIEIIRRIFQENGIKFIFLKGAVIRNLYPEVWQRTSCDIDALICEEDLTRAVSALKDAGFTTDGVKGYHDVSLFYGNVHLELHYNVMESIPSMDGLLGKIWDYTVKIDGFEFAELPEYFVFHHLAHMSYHCIGGGCGIRPFIDLFILKNKNFYDEQKLIPLLKTCGLMRFYNGVLELIEVWFNGREHSEMSAVVEKFILSGGVYGSTNNAHKLKTAHNKSKILYILRLIFLPYKNMCAVYPSLYKHKILLPFCYIHRLFSKLFGRKSARAKRNLQNILSNDKTAIAAADKILDYLGLPEEKL